jgi:peptide-methionine (S)-S-oxide reductase
MQCKRQYMSAIFYHDDEQKRLAVETMDKQKEKQKGKPITTLILPAEKFFVAEE